MFNEKGEKYCTKCFEYHPVGMFNRNSGHPSGYTSACKLHNRKKTLAQLSAAISFAQKETVLSVVGDMKLGSRYYYGRPDAYDLYIEKINSKA